MVFISFLHSFGAWEGWLGHLGNCIGGCWFQESDFSWILRLFGEILIAGQCLKPFLDAPWLGAGWLAGGLGGPGGAQDGRYHPAVVPCVGFWLGGSRGNLQISFPGT